LPPESDAFAQTQDAFLETLRLGGYQRIRVPVLEHTEVFARGVGESTDVVQKEMYTFTDRGGRSLTLRPEGTAGVMRAALQAGLPKGASLPVKWAYAGEFFRQERPQAGRQREFSQVGAEALGSLDPALDAEMVWLGWEALRRAGVEEVTLRIATLGDRGDREAYAQMLNAYLADVPELPGEVEARRHLNPLRAFDSKAPGMTEIVADAPVLADYVSDEAKAHHEKVVELLEAEGVPLTHDPRLVRGLDYYTRTTFEFEAGALGAQSAVGGGGRYDGLAEDLGSSDALPGIGWALGVDRTVLALQQSDRLPAPSPRVQAYVVVAAESLVGEGFALVSRLRRAGVAAELGAAGRGVRAQLKGADRAGARWALVLGADEAARGVVAVKELATGEQRELSDAEVVATLAGTT
jgi:histidyl-tRNA synthetase